MTPRVRYVENVESPLFSDAKPPSSYGDLGPGVIIPLPESDDEEACEDCGEYIDDCVCDDEDDL